jgi:gliding motility-associated lipoprotein GldH
MLATMKTRLDLIIFMAAILLFAGCEEAPTYEKTYAFENHEWQQNVKPSFTVDIKDVEKEYDFILTLRTTTEYKYSNLWIYMNTTTPDGQKAREPFEIKITNPDGSWIGKKTGTVVEHSLYFKRRKMPSVGKYVFVLEQGITNSKIDEMLDIGLMVQEVSAKK